MGGRNDDGGGGEKDARKMKGASCIMLTKLQSFTLPPNTTFLRTVQFSSLPVICFPPNLGRRCSIYR